MTVIQFPTTNRTNPATSNTFFPMYGNVVPISEYEDLQSNSYLKSLKSMPVSKKVHNDRSKMVYPLKNQQDITNMHKVLLEEAKAAKSTPKILAAYRNWFYFALGINLGFRGGDISELTWGQLVNADIREDNGIVDYDYAIRNEEDNFIRAEKTGKAATIILNQEAQRYIEFYLKATKPYGMIPYPNDPVFKSGKASGTKDATVSGHIDNCAMGKILKKAAEKAGFSMNFNTHSLRKTFGYHYFKVTQDIVTLQKIFGHSSPAITLAYIGIDSEKMVEAYNSKPDTGIDDLDQYLR